MFCLCLFLLLFLIVNQKNSPVIKKRLLSIIAAGVTNEYLNIKFMCLSFEERSENPAQQTGSQIAAHGLAYAAAHRTAQGFSNLAAYGA